MNIKSILFSIYSITCVCLTFLIGEFNLQLVILITIMIIDYILGIILAGIFHKSPKSEAGRLESKAGFKGIIRKAAYFVVVIIANFTDLISGNSFIRDCVIVCLIINEILSIIENLGLMGVPIPKVLINAIDILKRKSEDND